MTDSRHILIVDDDREIRTLLGDYLQKNGYRTTAVAEGKAMRRASAEGAPPQPSFFSAIAKKLRSRLEKQSWARTRG